MRIALIHDWLIGMRGGEKVLEVLCELYPDATIFTMLYEPTAISETIRNMNVVSKPSLRDYPLGLKKHRYYFLFYPFLVEKFNVRGYDLVISTSHCAAKGVIPDPNAVHICYCFTPARYIWDKYFDYFPNSRHFTIFKYTAPFVATYFRAWDQLNNARVNQFISISRYIGQQILKYYRRDSIVIHPPVDTDLFYIEKETPVEDFYLIVSAMVPYKRLDLAIKAFNQSKKRLIIVGIGPEYNRLRRMAKSNIEFTGWIDNTTLRNYYNRCKGLIFPGEEDFGIVPLEAMACGKPVIGFARGGLTETLKEGVNGIFFSTQTPESILEAVEKYERLSFNPDQIRESILPYSRNRFKTNMSELINSYNENLDKNYNILKMHRYPAQATLGASIADE